MQQLDANVAKKQKEKDLFSSTEGKSEKGIPSHSDKNAQQNKKENIDLKNLK